MMLASWGWAGKSIGGASVVIFRGNGPGNDGIVRFTVHRLLRVVLVIVSYLLLPFFPQRGLRSEAHNLHTYSKMALLPPLIPLLTGNVLIHREDRPESHLPTYHMLQCFVRII